MSLKSTPSDLRDNAKNWFVFHQHYIHEFLRAPDGQLYVGCSLQLQAIALTISCEQEQMKFMLSDAVQKFFEEAAMGLFLHSLAAERMAAMTKKREAEHIKLLSSVSRDMLCNQFSHWRKQQSRALDSAHEPVNQANLMSWHAMAWQQTAKNSAGLQERHGLEHYFRPGPTESKNLLMRPLLARPSSWITLCHKMMDPA